MTVATLERAPASERIQTIHAMLETYEQARSEPSGPGGGGTRNESRNLSFDPHTWTPAYQELERCLQQLRWLAQHGRPILVDGISAARLYWHLRERYLNSYVARREVHTRRPHNASGERVVAKLPHNMAVIARPTILHGKTSEVLVRVWDRRVDERVVRQALAWLADEYRGTPAVYKEQAA